MSYEIWNQSERAANFRILLEGYYRKIYCEHIKRKPDNTPAPKNFWPYSQQFYMCNPIKTFECVIRDANSPSASAELLYYVEPDADRSELLSEDMPTSLLNKSERAVLRRNGVDLDAVTAIDETTRRLLSLRNSSKPMPHQNEYHRL